MNWQSVLSIPLTVASLLLSDVITFAPWRRLPLDLNKVRKQTENSLAEIQKELELKVAQQRAELVRSNALLQEEIAKRKQMEELTIRSERLATLGRLAAALAHEISNPLQIIHGYLDLVTDFPLEPDEKERYLHIICCEIERLRDVSQNMLEFVGPASARRKAVSVAELIERVLALTNKELQQKGIKVSTDLRDAPLVMAVPEQLIQVFLNLLINAIESANSQLLIALRCDEESIVITFDDDGPTISPKILPNIFEPFYTTKPEGNGLGLWISRILVEKHEGTLDVENLNSEWGVRFTVTLPAAARLELEP